MVPTLTSIHDRWKNEQGQTSETGVPLCWDAVRDRKHPHPQED